MDEEKMFGGFTFTAESSISIEDLDNLIETLTTTFYYAVDKHDVLGEDEVYKVDATKFGGVKFYLFASEEQFEMAQKAIKENFGLVKFVHLRDAPINLKPKVFIPKGERDG